MYGCESWTIKKAEHRRIDPFELWCWRKVLRVPWTRKRSNQSILKETSPEYSLEGLVLKLKLQCFGHLMWRANYWRRPWCWEWLKTGGEGEDKQWDVWMASPTQWAWVWATSSTVWRTDKLGMLQSLASQRVRHDWATHTMGGWRRWPNFLLLYINISAFSLCLSDYKPLSIWMLLFSCQQTCSQYQSYFISNTIL